MTEKGYKNIQAFFQNHSFLYKLLKVLYKALPTFVLIAYPVILLTSVFVFYRYKSPEFLKVFFVPLAVFGIITIFRKLFNFQRPYEKYNTAPLIEKNKKGQSFPSRHVASAFIIAMAFLYMNTISGISFMVIAVAIALTRVLAGVHFIKDIVAGALFSLIVGYIFMFLI